MQFFVSGVPGFKGRSPFPSLLFNHYVLLVVSMDRVLTFLFVEPQKASPFFSTLCGLASRFFSPLRLCSFLPDTPLTGFSLGDSPVHLTVSSYWYFFIPVTSRVSLRFLASLVYRLLPWLVVKLAKFGFGATSP